MIEPRPQFPILLFQPSPWRDQTPLNEQVEDVAWFYDDDDFSSLDPWAIKRKQREETSVVDVTCRSWRVVRVIDLGAKGTSWKRFLRIIFRGEHRISHELAEDGTLPFEVLRERVCASIQGNPDSWRDDEAVAGEAGPPRDEQEMLDEITARVRRTLDMRALIDALQLSVDKIG